MMCILEYSTGGIALVGGHLRRKNGAAPCEIHRFCFPCRRRCHQRLRRGYDPLATPVIRGNTTQPVGGTHHAATTHATSCPLLVPSDSTSARRWMRSEEPMPKLPPAENEPLFLHVPLDGQGKGDGAADMKVRSKTFILACLLTTFSPCDNDGRRLPRNRTSVGSFACVVGRNRVVCSMSFIYQ